MIIEMPPWETTAEEEMENAISVQRTALATSEGALATIRAKRKTLEAAE
jgi:hypothetical protein